ncbi:hypothetical protein J6S46_01515 [Candidatus Saccharibacteria bacterium]|nr:hypothetical protein [Candidatus Saccharibacteria bacterium]
MMDSVIPFISAIIIIGILVFFAILLTGKRGHHFDLEYYQTRFLAIENKLNKENPVSFSLVVIEADKLLDRAMNEAGIPGKTMGDRLKRSGNRFGDVNAVWRAHKLRNTIAHEPDFEVSYEKAKNALESYKKALRDLGAI